MSMPHRLFFAVPKYPDGRKKQSKQFIKTRVYLQKNHFIKNEQVVSNIMFFGINNGNHYI